MNYSLPNYPSTFKVTYVIQLEDSCWYIGRATNGTVSKRVNQHLTQCGAAGWCNVHKPIKVHKVLKGDREEEVTRKYIDRYGADKVRGSAFVKVKDPSWDFNYSTPAYEDITI